MSYSPPSSEPLSPHDIITPENVVTVEQEFLEQESSRLSQAFQAAKTLGQAAVIATEVSYLNEAIRVSAFAAAQVQSGSPIAGALAYGGATLLIEGSAALATASALEGKSSQKAIRWVKGIANKVIPEDAKMDKITETGVAFFGGSAIAMMAKQIEDPERTTEQNRNYGLKVSAWLAGVCAVQGALMAEGIDSMDPTTIGAGALSIVGVIACARWAINRSKDSDVIGGQESHKARYDLSAEEIEELSTEIVDHVKAKFPNESMVGVWISPKSKYANFVRMHEASYFPEVAEVSEEDEEQTLFLALVDTRGGADRVVHGATITGVSYDSENQKLKISSKTEETTGMYTIDSLIEMGNFTSMEFTDFYNNKGIDLSNSFAVETNFFIGNRADRFLGIGTADMTYLMIMNVFKSAKIDMDRAAIFATINRASRISFDRVGITYEPLMGREDLVTEESQIGVNSQPVALLYDQKTDSLLRKMNSFLPEMHLS